MALNSKEKHEQTFKKEHFEHMTLRKEYTTMYDPRNCETMTLISKGDKFKSVKKSKSGK